MKKLFVFLLAIITIISCSKDPTKPEPQTPSEEIVLQDNVTEIKDSVLTDITNVTPTTMEFSDSTYTKDLEVGSIIVGGISEKTPNGFLRKVVNISSNKTTITTEYAALSDLIKSGKLEIKSAMFPKILQKKSLNQGFNLKPTTNGGFNFTYPFLNFIVYDLDNNYSTTNDQLRINGNLDFNAALDIELTFLPVQVDLTSEVMTDLTLRAEAELTGTINKEKRIGQPLYFTPLTIGVVVVTPVIESFVGIRGDLSASATAGIKDELTIEAGVHYSGGWTASDSINNKFTFDSMEVSLDGTLRGYAKAKLSFILYEIVGPSVYASPYLEGQIHINQTPWWKLYAGSEGGLGIKMGRIIPFINDFEYPLIDYPILLAQASTNTGTVTDIDGNTYQTVKIGNQWWMAENLKVTHYQNGDAIPNVTNSSTWSGLTTGAYCEYNNNINNAITYGRLYNWYAVDDNRNIAPAGWHVPSDDEWKELEIYLGLSQAQANATGWRGTDEGGKMKEAGTTHWNSPNTGATNSSGFTALPGGDRGTSSSSYLEMGNYAYFWSAEEADINRAWSRNLHYVHSDVGRIYGNKYDGYSIRCVRD